jgi:hypothetical protein
MEDEIMTEEQFVPPEESDELAAMRQQYIIRLKALQGDGDTEAQHSLADDLLCTLLIQLGYPDVVSEYVAIDKWYA